jgi:hypothetical protein
VVVVVVVVVARGRGGGGGEDIHFKEDGNTREGSKGYSLPPEGVRCGGCEERIRIAYDLKFRRSHTLTMPSSEPDASRCDTFLFQDITFTSAVCAATKAIERLRTRVSQMRIVLSTDAEAKT